MEVIPAILTNDVFAFEHQFMRLSPFCRFFQIDIQDGSYVPSKTLSISDLLVFVQSAKPSVKQALDRSFFDFHLMEHDYSRSLAKLEDLGCLVSIRYVFVHFNFSQRQNLGFSLCPTFNPNDEVKKDMSFLNKNLFSYPAIQIMTISPGPQGQPFLAEQLEKIHFLRMERYAGQILIDGSVNEQSISDLKRRGSLWWPDALCVGSYLSKAPAEELSGRIHTLSQT